MTRLHDTFCSGNKTQDWTLKGKQNFGRRFYRIVINFGLDFQERTPIYSPSRPVEKYPSDCHFEKLCLESFPATEKSDKMMKESTKDVRHVMGNCLMDETKESLGYTQPNGQSHGPDALLKDSINGLKNGFKGSPVFLHEKRDLSEKSFLLQQKSNEDIIVPRSSSNYKRLGDERANSIDDSSTNCDDVAFQCPVSKKSQSSIDLNGLLKSELPVLAENNPGLDGKRLMLPDCVNNESKTAVDCLRTDSSLENDVKDRNTRKRKNIQRDKDPSKEGCKVQRKQRNDKKFHIKKKSKVRPTTAPNNADALISRDNEYDISDFVNVEQVLGMRLTDNGLVDVLVLFKDGTSNWIETTSKHLESYVKDYFSFSSNECSIAHRLPFLIIDKDNCNKAIPAAELFELSRESFERYHSYKKENNQLNKNYANEDLMCIPTESTLFKKARQNCRNNKDYIQHDIRISRNDAVADTPCIQTSKVLERNSDGYNVDIKDNYQNWKNYMEKDSQGKPASILETPEENLENHKDDVKENNQPSNDYFEDSHFIQTSMSLETIKENFENRKCNPVNPKSKLVNRQEENSTYCEDDIKGENCQFGKTHRDRGLQMSNGSLTCTENSSLDSLVVAKLPERLTVKHSEYSIGELQVVESDFTQIILPHGNGKSKEINTETCDDLIHLLEQKSTDSQCNFVAIIGLEEYFSSSSDYEKILMLPAHMETSIYDRKIASLRYLFQTLKNYPKPIIAVVSTAGTGLAASVLSLVDVVYDQASSNKNLIKGVSNGSTNLPLLFPKLMGLLPKNEALLMGEIPDSTLDEQIRQIEDTCKQCSFSNDLKRTLKDMRFNHCFPEGQPLKRLRHSKAKNNVPGRLSILKSCRSKLNSSQSQNNENSGNGVLKGLQEEVEREKEMSQKCLQELKDFWKELVGTVI